MLDRYGFTDNLDSGSHIHEVLRKERTGASRRADHKCFRLQYRRLVHANRTDSRRSPATARCLLLNYLKRSAKSEKTLQNQKV